MYRNFKLTEEEKREILESHKSHGYKTVLNENMGRIDFYVQRRKKNSTGIQKQNLSRFG